MTKEHSIWVKLDRFPPLLIRLLARERGGSLMSDEAIIRRSGGRISRAHLAMLTHATTWDDVPVGLMKAFVLACNADFANPTRMKSLTRYISHYAGFRFVRNPSDIDRLKQLAHT